MIFHESFWKQYYPAFVGEPRKEPSYAEREIKTGSYFESVRNDPVRLLTFLEELTAIESTVFQGFVELATFLIPKVHGLDYKTLKQWMIHHLESSNLQGLGIYAKSFEGIYSLQNEFLENEALILSFAANHEKARVQHLHLKRIEEVEETYGLS